MAKKNRKDKNRKTPPKKICKNDNKKKRRKDNNKKTP